MRDIKLIQENGWLVLVITGKRIRRVYLERDEAALVASLLNKELERG